MRSRGFTLVELLVVLALLCLVAVAAVPVARDVSAAGGSPTRVQLIRALGNATLADGAGVKADVVANPPLTNAFYATDVTVPAWATKLQIVFATDTGSTFKWKRGAAGTYTTVSEGATLVATSEYLWTMRVQGGDAVNFKLGTSGTLYQFRVIAEEN